jgi:hypothetical protein
VKPQRPHEHRSPRCALTIASPRESRAGCLTRRHTLSAVEPGASRSGPTAIEMPCRSPNEGTSEPSVRSSDCDIPYRTW